MKKTLNLGIAPLTFEEIRDVARDGRKVELSSQSIALIEKSHCYLLKEIQTGKTYYGVNTGFGLLSNVKISAGDLKSLQYNLLRSHACGWGPSLEDAPTRAMLLLRANNLAIGNSGVSLGLIRQILALLNHGVTPVVPIQGSVGASGDLAPLSHLALPLIGEGRAKVKGIEMDGLEALRSQGLSPITLGPKEGLALINGTQFMTAIGALNLLDAETLCDQADLAGAMSLEALRGTTRAFDELIHKVRPHPGQIQVAANLRNILTPPQNKTEGRKTEISASHATCDKVQDPYSLRCMPQVHGASRDALSFVRQVIEREINSVTDNPLIFPDQEKILSGGNFHGQAVAMAMDFLAIAVAELGSISEQRLEKLMNPSFSGLPSFLSEKGGLNSGFMMVQVAAAAIVSENKTLCHPASVDSIPTSADKEDHVSMGAWAARKAAQVVTNVRRVIGMEFLAAAQGIDLLRPLKSSATIEKAHFKIRKEIKKFEEDRVFYPDFEKIEKLLQSENFHDVTRLS